MDRIDLWMGVTNSCINPILYNFFDDPNFHNRLRQMLRKYHSPSVEQESTIINETIPMNVIVGTNNQLQNEPASENNPQSEIVSAEVASSSSDEQEHEELKNEDNVPLINEAETRTESPVFISNNLQNNELPTVITSQPTNRINLFATVGHQQEQLDESGDSASICHQDIVLALMLAAGLSLLVFIFIIPQLFNLHRPNTPHCWPIALK